MFFSVICAKLMLKCTSFSQGIKHIAMFKDSKINHFA